MLESVNNATEAFDYLVGCLKKHGVRTSPRGMDVIEINGIGVKIENSFDNVVRDSRRKMSPAYLVAELIWYSNGNQTYYGNEMIFRYAPFWKQLVNNDGSLNSNYGAYVLNGPQVFWVLGSLIKDPDTRQAVFNINAEKHKRIISCKDFPCTLGMHLFIRNNKLNSVVTMRSTDLIKGFCNDIYQFSQMQKLIWQDLVDEKYRDLELGSISLFTDSLHIYKPDWAKVFDTQKRPVEYKEFRDYSKDDRQLNRIDMKVLSIIEEINRTDKKELDMFTGENLVNVRYRKALECREFCDMGETITAYLGGRMPA
jgi:thymidylate synthase